MSFLQVRINHADNGAAFFREFAVPLRIWLAQRYFNRWTIARGWQNGPHYLLTFDTGAPFYRAEWADAIAGRARSFLDAHPSAPVERAAYVALQARLNQAEAAGIDPGALEPNDTVATMERSAAQLAARFESLAQWHSLFDLESGLGRLLIDRRGRQDDGERIAFELMALLACTYPPAPSTDPSVFEYNGFVSYQSNYLFWHHALPPARQQEITRRFELAYAEHAPAYAAWLEQIETALVMPGHPAARLGQFLVDAYLENCRLAREGVIHERSPFAPARLAPRDTVSAFHGRHFYADDGGARSLGWEFAAYRWLLNVAYRALPLLGVTPMTRQRLNHSLDRLQREQAARIRRIRAAMLAGAAGQAQAGMAA